MRASVHGVLACFALAGCSVSDKQPATDAGADAPVTPDTPVDDAAPETTITAAPDEFSRASSAVFEFQSDDATAHFECSIDEETPVPCSSPYTRALGDGPHGFVVRAIDDAGNSDDSPAEHRWSIDTRAPDTTLTGKPPIADNSVTVRFDFESNEELVDFECSLDNASYSPCEPGVEVGPLGDGAHSFAVRARDRAGNIDASPAIHAWNVDTSTPDTQILSGPDGPTASTSATFTFISPDAGSGATFTCALDGGAFNPCTSPRTFTGLTSGTHRFAVRVRDAVGNLDPTPATREWSVDVTPPTTTILSGPTGVVPSASATFTFTANETDVTFACSVDNGAFQACTSPFTLMQLAQGAHTFAVRATDSAGHTDPSPATRAWTVDTVAPDITFTAGPANGSVSGPRVTFAFSASEGTPSCSLDTAPFAACTSPRSFSLPAGAHQFRVRATDAAGNVTTETIAWTVACAAPTAAGAAGLLHLDDGAQVQVDAVAGGVDATLGSDATVEPIDPSPVAGRFDGGLAFDALDGDLVAWPAALGATPAFTIELWVRPDAPAGMREVFASGDGRIAVRVTAASPTTVRFSIAAVETGGGAQTRIATSAAVTAGDWHHVLASLQEPTLRLWVDGVRTESGNVEMKTPAALDTIRLGGNFSGSLDEVWLAQTAITADEAALARYCPL